ncbi:MAG TPA: type II toxin-antitoxin system HicB family antitoxin [Alphaproteobacteria bacterium]|nr:type II toxin-antitoxin system HicB family antitoxin [Alphaproteobacteria bacterium]
MASYIALIHKDDGSDYGVSFPDFPGCITAGSTLDQARTLAAEALAFHIEGMIEDGDAIPEPSDLTQVMSDPENRDGVAVLVDAPARHARKIVRLNITLPKDVLQEIDRFAESQGYTRSGFLAHAARKVIREEAA